MVCFSDSQKQFFNRLSDSDKPRFLFNCPDLIDCTFLFLGESPSQDFNGYGYFMPITNHELPNLPRVIDCHLSCFVALKHGKPLKDKRDKYKESLIQLSEHIIFILDSFDKSILNAENISKEHLEKFANIVNALDFANDRARLSAGLQIDAESKKTVLEHIKLLLNG